MDINPARTYVYIDGFNLYYGLLKGTPYKWLDLQAILRKYLCPDLNTVLKIKYFTALVKPRKFDPDQHIRQEMYIRALKTIPNLEVIYGHFLSHAVTMRRADGNGFVQVIKTEEKKSDVNLAVHMLHDAHLDLYDTAVLMSNDSDFSEPLRIIARSMNKFIGILNPQNKFSYELGKYANFKKRIRINVAAACQFPAQMHDENGMFHKPIKWNE